LRAVIVMNPLRRREWLDHTAPVSLEVFKMGKIRVNAAVLVRDVRRRVGLKTLLEKHGLSYPNMLKVKKLLVERGYSPPEEFDYLNLSEVRPGHSVSAKEFLDEFRERPDDLYLMERYMLSVKELRVVYESLILAGWLSEYEYHSRAMKAPESEEQDNSGYEDSTEVTLLRTDLETRCAVPLRAGDVPPRKSFPHDSIVSRAVSAGPENVRPQFDFHAAHTAAKEPSLEHCPKCGLASHPSSPDACIYCGVVFSKAKLDPKYEGVAVWD
jgi:hypothetical protein